jgi:hypothetical protein
LIVKKQDKEGKYFTSEDPEMSVSFNLPGYITFFAPPLHQLFRNPQNTAYRQLKHKYPTAQSMYGDAECYADGIINKERFLKTINNPAFLKRYNLGEGDKQSLIEFITNINCSYKSAREQLFIKGYGHIADFIDFSDPTLELIRSCELFLKFIDALP